MAVRRRELSRDTSGYFRPYIGWVRRSGRRIQPRFNLGKDEHEARIRYAKIQKLLANSGAIDWEEGQYALAVQIAKGERQVRISPNPKNDQVQYWMVPGGGEALYAQEVAAARLQNPDLEITPADPTKFKNSVNVNVEVIQQEIARLEAMLKLALQATGQQSLPDIRITGSWHEALDAYCQSIESTGAKHESGELLVSQDSRCRRAKLLQSTHDNFSLGRLDHAKIDHIIGYWRNRPHTKKGDRASCGFAKNMVEEIDRFLRWLETTSFGWTRPRGLGVTALPEVVRP